MKTKTCTKCKKEKDLLKFAKQQRSKDGRCSWCKSCHNEGTKDYYRRNKDKVRSTQKKWDSRNREYRKRQQLKRYYDISLEEHEQIYLVQKGCCAICENQVEYSKAHTDHNHVTGEVRGLLCHKCNHYLFAVENKDFFSKALAYLSKHGCHQI